MHVCSLHTCVYACVFFPCMYVLWLVPSPSVIQCPLPSPLWQLPVCSMYILFSGLRHDFKNLITIGLPSLGVQVTDLYNYSISKLSVLTFYLFFHSLLSFFMWPSGFLCFAIEPCCNLLYLKVLHCWPLNSYSSGYKDWSQERSLRYRGPFSTDTECSMPWEVSFLELFTLD